MPPPFPWQVTPSLRSSEIVGDHTDFSGGRGLYTQTFGTAPPMSGSPRSRTLALARGNAIVTLDEAETARWREAARATIERWISERAAEGIDGAVLHETAWALVEQYLSD